jgi:hypothetical protein
MSTPEGTAGEYADTRDFSAGWGSGGDGNERPVGSLGFGFALDTCAPAADFPVLALDFAGFAAGGGAGAGYVYGSLGTLSALTCCI